VRYSISHGRSGSHLALLIALMCRNFLQFLGRKKLVEAHLGQHLVLDGDTILLHEEERLIRMKQAESGHSDWDRLFYLPTASDAPVRAFRHWLSAATDNGEGPTNTVDWAPGVSRELPPLERNRAVLLDRLNSHTLQCSECRKGLEDAIFAKKLSFSLACVFVATSAALSSIRMSSAAAGLALICAANGYRQMKQQQRFVFEDYVHASRDS
jgi:pheophorbide a oxygenase